MKVISIKHALVAAAILAFAPAAALAQDDVEDRAKEIAEQAKDVQEQAGELANDVSNTRAAEDADVLDNGNVGLDADNDGNDGVDDGFDWGLLGLLGLAGLLGLQKRDRVDHTRTDTRL